MKRAALILALGALLAGCSDPYAHAPRGVASPAPRPASPPNSATAAARTFAARWINWGWRTAAQQQLALAGLAEGRLAEDLRTNAASARIDAGLRRDKPSVRGAVAIVSLEARDYRVAGLVVTREQRFTAGRSDLGGAHYRVYAIALHHRGGRWGVSAWKPQP